MVGHEYIRGVFIYSISPFHLNANSKHKGTDPHGLFSGPNQRFRPTEKITAEKNRNQKDGDQNIENEKDDRPHDRGCSL
jgi:hypothetical protein